MFLSSTSNDRNNLPHRFSGCPPSSSYSPPSEAETKERRVRPKTRAERALPHAAKVYIERGAVDLGAMPRTAAAKRMEFTTDCVEANIFVTAAPAYARAPILWAISLNGGIICDPTYFHSDGERGTALVYTSAINRCRRSRRLLWATARFKRKFPDIVDVVRRSVSKKDRPNSPSSASVLDPSQSVLGL